MTAPVEPDNVAKDIADIKSIIKLLDPEGKIKVTRTDALEWWERERLANKRGGR
jgi:hypothetical protein